MGPEISKGVEEINVFTMYNHKNQARIFLYSLFYFCVLALFHSKRGGEGYNPNTPSPMDPTMPRTIVGSDEMRLTRRSLALINGLKLKTKVKVTSL